MGVHSGKFAVVGGQTAVRNWVINDVSTPERYIASNTVFVRFTKAGVGDWNGSFSGFGGTPPLSIMPGDIFTFQGYTAPSTDVFGNDGAIYSGTAIVDSLTIDWNWEPGNSLMWTCNFSAASAGLTVDPADILADVSATIPERMCGLKIQVGAAGSEADWANLVSASLNITSENVAFVNSSTNCFTGRKPGNIDWTLEVVEQNELQTYAKGVDHRLRCYVSATTFWVLEWGHLVEYSGLTVDRETGAIIQKTANFVMNGSNNTVLGKITHPGTTNIWPEIASP